MFNNQIIAGSSGQGGSFYPYSVDQSLRFNDNDSAYLNRTFASAGNQKTWTWSGWVKRGNIGSNQDIFSPSGASPNQKQFRIGSTGTITFYHQVSGTVTAQKWTTQLLRDVSAWYHIVLEVDTTNATAADRIKIYVNGDRVTSFDTSTDPALNADLVWNSATNHFIGNNNSQYFDGYMAEVNFIDGTALDPTSFGEEVNGIWVPKAYDTADGAYGTNGFYLSFADSSAIGDDLSGNTNDFTANNLVASDVVPDSPTNSFCTMNILDDNFSTPKFTYFEGNLKYTYSYTGAGFDRVFGTHMIEPGDTNKYYMEFTGNVTNEQMQWGIVATDSTTYSPSDRTQGITAASDINTLRWASYTAAPYLRRIDGDGDNALTTTNGNAANGDIFSIVYDAGAGKTFGWFNGVEFSGQDYSAGTSLWTTLDTTKTYAVMMYQGDGGGSTKNGNMTANFGQDSSFAGAKTAQGNTDANGIGDFYYAVPTDAVALCSANLPEPTISPNSEEQADDYFNTAIWSGNSTSGRDIVTGHATDFVWIKSRSNATNHYLFDSIRGVNNQLLTNATSAEAVVSSNRMTAFNADGFEVGDFAETNGTGYTFVGWSWKAGGTAVSNTDGSITSQVSAAPDAGFSIVTYTGAGGVSTIGHGLSQPLDVFIVKNRGATSDWEMFHSALGNTARIELQSNAAQVTGITGWNSTSPTDTVFTVNGGAAGNTSGNTHLAFCFHSVDGFSRATSYVGNGSTDGTFCFLGHRPAWIMLKNASASGAWYIFDVKRNTYNVMDKYLRPNLANAEGTLGFCDFTSNGFKIRSSAAEWNGSGNTIIVLSFAEQPFKYSNAR